MLTFASLSSPKFLPSSLPSLLPSELNFFNGHIHHKHPCLLGSIPRRTPSLSTCGAGPYVSHSAPPLTAEELQNKFGCEGLNFSDVAGLTVMEMTVSNKSSARLALPDAIVTSYKPMMWHGGTEEMLHTEVANQFENQRFLIKGGIETFVAFSDMEIERRWFHKSWFIEAVDVQPQKYVQVLLSTVIKMEHADGYDNDDDPSLDITYVVTLLEKALSTAVSISNMSRLSVKFTSSVFTHLAVSSAEAVFATGLKGCKFCRHQFQSMDIDEVKATERKSPNLVGRWTWLKSSVDARMINTEKELTLRDNSFNSSSDEEHASSQKGISRNWVTEKEDYAPFKRGLGKLYSMPPENVTIFDRGKRRSVILGRLGFKNFFLSGPGLDLELEGQDKYICAGPASILEQVDLYPCQKWQAAQILHNYNL